MQVLSFLKNGKRYDITAEALEILRKDSQSWAEWDATHGKGKDKAGNSPSDRIKDWKHVEKPVLGRTQGGNWLYQRLLHNIKAKQTGQAQVQGA